MTNMTTRPKWSSDGIGTHETWWLGDEESPLATVSPEWSETRCAGRGKPDRWTARDANGNNLGARSSRREATKLAEDAVLRPQPTA